MSEDIQRAKLSTECVEKLKRILPPMAIVNRPEGYIDMSAAALERAHGQALETVLAEKGVDAVILISVPPTFLNPSGLAKEIIETAKNTGKPVLTCLMAGDWVKEARILLEKEGLPTFDLPQQAAKAVINMVKRKEFLNKIAREVQ